MELAKFSRANLIKIHSQIRGINLFLYPSPAHCCVRPLPQGERCGYHVRHCEPEGRGNPSIAIIKSRWIPTRCALGMTVCGTPLPLRERSPKRRVAQVWRVRGKIKFQRHQHESCYLDVQFIWQGARRVWQSNLNPHQSHNPLIPQGGYRQGGHILLKIYLLCAGVQHIAVLKVTARDFCEFF